MSLIRVQCETCQATLRVRDAGFVGEVHACPRCGSMVLIGGGAGAAAPATAETPLESSTLVMSDTLETLAVPDTTPPPPEPVAESVVETLPAELADEPLAAAASWAPLATTVASLMATGAILAIWMLSGPAEETAQADPASPIEPPVVAEQPSVAAKPPVTPSVAEPDPTQVNEPPAIEPIEASKPLAESLPPEPVASEPPPTRIALADPTPEPPVAAPMLHEEPAGEIDPLAFDPSEAVVILRRGVAAEPDPIEPLPADPPPVADPAPPTLDERLAAAANAAGVFVRLGPTDASSVPFAGSAQTALTQVVPSLELRGVPLDQAGRLLGQIAGVPITLEPSALRYAGVAATKPVDLVGDQLTVATILSQSLKPARLAYEADGPHLATVRQGMDREREVTHRLGDLTRSDPEGLVAQLQQLVPFAGPTDLSADGTLTLTASMATQYDLRVLCERLRLARGLQPQSKYPQSLLPTDSSLARLEPILGRRMTFSFVEPTPLDQVFEHWRRATRLSILIDWRALADAGLGPQSRLACSVTNRAWRDGLDGVLNPLGLGWTALDGKTLWISTEASLADFTTIEFLAVPEANAEPIRKDLLNRHPTAAIVYDTRSERLLVRGNAATQRDAARSIAR